MSKLNLFGKEIAFDKELEIIQGDFGMNIYLIYKDGETETRRNCTEFHHLYRDTNSAIESDIHSTGGTFDSNIVESIVITKASKLYNEHRGD